MTPNDALLTLIAELRCNIADADAQRDAALQQLSEERDRNTVLQARVNELERDGAMVGVV